MAISIDKNIRKKFPIYKSQPDLVYLDSAASSLVLESVVKAETEYYRDNGTNVHRGAYALSYQATEQCDLTRAAVAQYINSAPEEVIFTRGTTDSLNLLAGALRKHYGIEKGQVLTTQLEHHSSLLPWYDLEPKYIPLVENRITLEAVQEVMTPEIKVVVLTHVANTLGYMTPVTQICRFLHKFNNCLVILDCAQSVIHLHLDVRKLDVDFLAFSSHKMFGPSGVGVLYGKEKLLNLLPPLQYGGEMVDKVSLTEVEYKQSPMRHEAGTQNVAGIIAFKPVFDFLNQVGIKKLYQFLYDLHHALLEQMLLIPEVIIYNPDADAPIILFNVKDVHPHDIATFLDTQQICVRAGFHCAQLVADLLDAPWTLRLSLSIYNNEEDCQKFLKGLQEAILFFRGKNAE
jgi:cysteine desulfurase/selenocysteine lyase